jgi:hypothetical protein
MERYVGDRLKPVERRRSGCSGGTAVRPGDEPVGPALHQQRPRLFVFEGDGPRDGASAREETSSRSEPLARPGPGAPVRGRDVPADASSLPLAVDLSKTE